MVAAATVPASAANARRILLISDPRFPGGTASAIADEIPVLCRDHAVRFAALDTKMFSGRNVNNRFRSALDSAGIDDRNRA